MDAMTVAKKKVLGDLIREMRRRMVETDDAPALDEAVDVINEDTEADDASLDESLEGDSAESETVSAPRKGVTITLAAIKKAPPKPLKMKSELPDVLQAALMGKERFKKKA